MRSRKPRQKPSRDVDALISEEKQVHSLHGKDGQEEKYGHKNIVKPDRQGGLEKSGQHLSSCYEGWTKINT